MVHIISTVYFFLAVLATSLYAQSNTLLRKVNQGQVGKRVWMKHASDFHKVCPAQYERDISVLRQEMNQLKKQNVELQILHAQVLELQTELEELRVSATEQKHHKNLVANSPNVPGVLHTNDTICFSARATATNIYGPDDIIAFPGIIYRSGAEYNNATSTFVCRLTGIYFFALNGRFRFSNDTWTGDLSLVRNNEKFADMRVNVGPKVGINWYHASTGVITMCTAGDLVFVQTKIEAWVYHECADAAGDHCTTFSGFLLAQL